MGAPNKTASRMTRVAIGIVALAGGLLTARTARADVCVDVDTSRDNLPEPDRAATKPLLEHAFEKSHQRVVPAGCPNVYHVYHVKLGSSVTIVLTGPNGDSRTMKVNSIEDIPEAYDQMVKALLTNTPLGIEGAGIDRTNVTTTQGMPPSRVQADSLFYVRLGVGTVLGGDPTFGPDFGLGWRWELDRIAIDLSILNLMLTQENHTYKNASGSWVKLMVLYYFDPYANNSLYAGAGLSWGGTSVFKNTQYYSQTGLAGEIAVGYEMLRVSNVRLLLQLNASLPTYAVRASEGVDYVNGQVVTTPGGSMYAPTLGLSFGLGFGKSNTLVVRTVH
jgi:hypothetical protein